MRFLLKPTLNRPTSLWHVFPPNRADGKSWSKQVSGKQSGTFGIVTLSSFLQPIRDYRKEL